jgi:hypothetical protein
MRTKFLFFAMLASIAASATVTVTPLSTDYDAKKVTFKVEWTNAPIAPCNNRVWIWIDFCPVSGVTPQSFSTATIISPTITGGNGTITNTTARGFFIEYGATNAGTTVTATLSNAPAGKFNWCAYGSAYPPNIGDYNNGIYTLRGTTPFTLYDENGTTQIVKGTTIARSSLNIEPITMTDATGCPGNFCKYVGSDLYMNATTYKCQQRTSGAQNWEAWIKDTRDGTMYRIVQVNTTWWFGDYLIYGNDGTMTCDGYKIYEYSTDIHCPAGWDVPTVTQWMSRMNIEPDYPWTNVYGGAIPTEYWWPCVNNPNRHMHAKDHTVGHCWYYGDIPPYYHEWGGCNTNKGAVAICVRSM